MIKEINNILIVGDSFASDRDRETDWPLFLSKKFVKSNLYGKGYPGGSWWLVRKHILEVLSKKNIDLLIVVHTDYNRLPLDFNIPSNLVTCEMEDNTKNKYFKSYDDKEVKHYDQEYRNSVISYFKHLYNEDFFKWATIQWYQELDDLLLEKNIPYIIHLHGFWDFGDRPYLFKSGITSVEPLFMVQSKQPYFSQTQVRNNNNKYVHVMRNHFNDQDNVIFAETIFSVLEKIDPYTNFKWVHFNFLQAMGYE